LKARRLRARLTSSAAALTVVVSSTAGCDDFGSLSACFDEAACPADGSAPDDGSLADVADSSSSSDGPVGDARDPDRDASPACTGEGVPCSAGGLCHAGACDSNGCFVAGTWFAAGARDPANGCSLCDARVSPTSWTPVPEGAACTSAGSAGACRGTTRVCCTGCWTGTSCVAGTDPRSCGAAGGGCSDCDALLVGGSAGNCTNDATCSGGAAMHYFVPAICNNSGGCAYGSASCCTNGCNGAGCL